MNPSTATTNTIPATTNNNNNNNSTDDDGPTEPDVAVAATATAIEPLSSSSSSSVSDPDGSITEAVTATTATNPSIRSRASEHDLAHDTARRDTASDTTTTTHPRLFGPLTAHAVAHHWHTTLQPLVHRAIATLPSVATDPARLTALGDAVCVAHAQFRPVLQDYLHHNVLALHPHHYSTQRRQAIEARYGAWERACGDGTAAWRQTIRDEADRMDQAEAALAVDPDKDETSTFSSIANCVLPQPNQPLPTASDVTLLQTDTTVLATRLAQLHRRRATLQQTNRALDAALALAESAKSTKHTHNDHHLSDTLATAQALSQAVRDSQSVGRTMEEVTLARQPPPPSSRPTDDEDATTLLCDTSNVPRKRDLATRFREDQRVCPNGRTSSMAWDAVHSWVRPPTVPHDESSE